MKILLPWLGLIVIVLWLTTAAIALTMMWHPDWMNGDPPAKNATVAVHMAAVVLGLGLGPLLWVKPVAEQLNIAARIGYLIGFGLAVLTVWRSLF